MPPPMVEYQKVMTEIVYVNLPDFKEPVPGMGGSELFHGFIAEFAWATNPEVKAFVDMACAKWNVHFRTLK
jgi:hypothetical protein